jgi:hypothetical protein
MIHRVSFFSTFYLLEYASAQGIVFFFFNSQPGLRKLA